MEQRFTIALWMFVLVGQLHAAPVEILTEYMMFDELRSISCNETARFSSPTNVTDDCYNASLEVFMKEMELAKDSCTDKDNRIDQAVEVMDNSLSSTQTHCSFNMTVHQQFASFVKAMETFIQNFNSHSVQKRSTVSSR